MTPESLLALRTELTRASMLTLFTRASDGVLPALIGGYSATTNRIAAMRQVRHALADMGHPISAAMAAAAYVWAEAILDARLAQEHEYRFLGFRAQEEDHIRSA